MNSTQKDELAKLGIRGYTRRNHRLQLYYLVHLLPYYGLVNHEMEGRLARISHDNELKGVDGVQQVRKDAFQNAWEHPKNYPSRATHTTIDASIQAILEDELQVGVHQYQANYGTGIIMDPTTGEILAMANYQL